jgi:hypothetical protein
MVPGNQRRGHRDGGWVLTDLVVAITDGGERDERPASAG